MTNQLVRINRPPPAVVHRQLEHTASIARDLADRLVSSFTPADPDDVARAKAIVNDEVLQTALIEAQQPASRAQIGSELGNLVTCYPYAGKRSLEGYGRHLVEDIIEMQPTRFALERACRELRRTSKFLPAISEVIEAVEDAEERLELHAKALRRLAEAIPRSEQAERVRIERERARADHWRAKKLRAEFGVAPCKDRK
jgi:hypothetical protein